LRLNNKVVLITGGTRGIGKAIADLFFDNGADIIVTGKSKPSSNLNSKYKFYQVDFSKPDMVNGFLSFIEKQKRIDILINNSGINKICEIGSINHEDFIQVNEVNYFAPFKIMQIVSNKMIDTKTKGRIVNIASIWSNVTLPGRLSYSSAKSALVGMTRAAAVDLAKYHILVNAISPGFVLTKLTRDSLGIDGVKAIEKNIPLRRLAEPIEVANLALYLSSDEQSYMTGQNIVIDGGYSGV